MFTINVRKRFPNIVLNDPANGNNLDGGMGGIGSGLDIEKERLEAGGLNHPEIYSLDGMWPYFAQKGWYSVNSSYDRQISGVRNR